MGITTERKGPDPIQSFEETDDVGIASGSGGIGINSGYAQDLQNRQEKEYEQMNQNDTFKSDSMISDKDFDEKGFDRLFHPGAVADALNWDGGIGLFEESLERDEGVKMQVYTSEKSDTFQD